MILVNKLEIYWYMLAAKHTCIFVYFTLVWSNTINYFEKIEIIKSCTIQRLE